MKHLLQAIISFSLAFVGAPLLAQGANECRFNIGAAVPNTFDPRSLAGWYEVLWQPAKNARQRLERREQLYLWRTSPSDSFSKHGGIHPDPSDTLVYPLFGAFVPHDSPPGLGASLRQKIDSIYPPVLLFLGWPRDTTRTTWQTLVLLVETVRTRQPDVISTDGAGVGITLHHVGPYGFAGTYDRWGIAVTDSGSVCARRIE